MHINKHVVLREGRYVNV